MRKLRFLMPIGILAILAGFSAVVMLLWNWLMPVIFGLVSIDFWQAAGILILSRILFGGFGVVHGLKRHGWRHHMREKWMKMTSEQRQEFINKRMKHFDKGGFFGGRGFDFDADENKPKNNE